MSIDLTAYYRQAPLMQPGDIIAFCGPSTDPLSFLIKAWTGSRFTHTAMVQRHQIVGGPDVVITESTIMKEAGKTINGVQSHSLAEVLIDEYSNPSDLAYHLALKPEYRAQIDPIALDAYASAMVGKVAYDVVGYLAFGLHDIPFIGAHLMQNESMKRAFCSAWCAEILDHFNVLRGVDFTHTNPWALIRMNLFSQWTQILGKPTPIQQGWNSIGVAP